MSSDVEFLRELAVTENIYPVALLAEHTSFKKLLCIDVRNISEALKATQGYRGRFNSEDVVEPAHVRQALDERELSTFKKEWNTSSLLLSF